MKWGVRRYQNKDGSLTEAGKRRREQDLRNMKPSKRKDYVENPDKWVTDDMYRTKKVTESTKQMSTDLQNLNKTNRKYGKTYKKMDLSNRTDKELRDEINRKFLEKQYQELFAEPTKAEKGRQRAEKILEYSNVILGIGATSLGIALSIRELMGKGK